jgi:hypothetical protein
MLERLTLPRLLAVGAMLSALVIGAACSEDEVEAEPDVATLRLLIGTNDTVLVSDNGTVTSGPIAINANTTISAQWLKADGTPETIVTDAVFQLNVIPANSGVLTFTRTRAFAGTLNRVSAGSTTIQFSLFHIAEGHEDFGPFPVSITVT